MALAAVGTLSYGSVTFDALYHSTVTGRPVMNIARRAVSHIEYTITVEAGIVTTPGATLDTWRDELQAAGKVLKYNSKGFGTLEVNVGGVKDVAFGPIPELLEFTPMNDQGATVKWRVKTSIPDCAGNPKFEKLPMDFHHTATFSIDGDGYTSYSVAGEIVIPMQQANGKIPDTADNYRERLQSDIPKGFHRTNQEYTVSDDKRVLSFRFTDRELPAPLPQGCTRCDVHHRVRWDRSKPFHISGSIGGPITVAAGHGKSTALLAFMGIIREITSNVRNELGQPKALKPPPNFFPPAVVAKAAKAGAGGANQIGVLLIKSFSIDENLFGPTDTFNYEYTIIGSGIGELVSGTSLYQNLGILFGKWSDSIANSAHHIRGNAKLKHDARKEAVVALCLDDPDKLNVQAGKGIKVGVAGKNARGKALEKNIRPEKSWINFRNRLHYEQVEGVIQHVPIGGGIIAGKPPDAAKHKKIAGQVIFKKLNDAVEPNKFQQVHSPVLQVRMVGMAERVKFKIPPPNLVSVGGVKPRVLKEHIRHNEIRKIADVPVYFCAWDITYIFDKPVKGDLVIASSPAEEKDAK